MGRRSLPKIRGDLDLTPYIILSDQLPPVISSMSLFGNSAPLELEIGSGKGLFIRKAAKQFPDHNFLGIEIAYRYALNSAAGLCKYDCSNAKMVNADASVVLRDKCEANSLDAVHVYFPDPWWKKAHRKRRILRTDVLQWIEKVLRPGALLHFWTDVEEYYLSTLKLIAAETTLIGPFEVSEQEAQNDMDYRTHFERRTRLNELPVYRSFFKKKSADSQ